MKKTQKIMIYGGGILLAIITAMVLFLNGAIDYYWKLDQLLPNIVLLPIGVIIMICAFLHGKHVCIKRVGRHRSYGEILRDIIIVAILFYILQLFLYYQIYFRTGWDPDVIFIGALRLMSGGDLTAIEGYLSLYPNNALLVLVQSFLLKFNMMFGVMKESDGLFALVASQCAFVSMAGVILFDVLNRMTHRVEVASMGYTAFFLLQITSPWTVIPYTDTMGLIIPLVILDLSLIKTERTWTSILRWVMIGIGTYLAYQLKPQLAILSIAVALVGLTKLIGKQPVKTAIKHVPAWGAFVLAFLLTAAALPIAEQKLLPVDIDENRNMIPTHYIMMGLNTERDGAYVHSDVLLSESLPNKALRQQENLRVIRERLSDMGIGGLFTHLIKKTLSCYADGTFFWGREGNFYYQVPSEKNTFLSPLLRNIFYNDGDYYDYWVLFRQAMWVAVLVFACFAVLAAKNSSYDTTAIAVIFLAIVGLTAFELLFESRARYLYSYVPIYLIAAVIGFDAIWSRVRKR